MDKQVGKPKYVKVDGERIEFKKTCKFKLDFFEAELKVFLCPGLENSYGMHYEGNIFLESADINTIAHEVLHYVFWLMRKKGSKLITVEDHFLEETIAYIQGFLTEKVHKKVSGWLK